MIRLIKILIISLFFLISSQSRANRECDTIKYKISLSQQSVTDQMLREDRVYFYYDESHLYVRVKSGMTVWSKISLCNELGLCTVYSFFPSNYDERVEFKKEDYVKFIVIKVWEDIIIDRFFEVYVFEITK